MRHIFARVGKGGKGKKGKKKQSSQATVVTDEPASNSLTTVVPPSLLTTDRNSPATDSSEPESAKGWKAASENLGTFVARLIETVGDRVLEEVDNTTGFVMAALSIALVHWILEKTLLLAGMNPHSNEAIIIRSVILGSELGLILDFVMRRIRRK